MILWVKDKTLVDTTEPLVPNFSLPPYLIITIHPHKNAIKVPSFPTEMLKQSFVSHNANALCFSISNPKFNLLIPPKKPNRLASCALNVGLQDVTEVIHNKVSLFSLFLPYLAAIDRDFMLSVKVLIAAGFSGAIGQLLKPFTSVVFYKKKLDFRTALQAGGFPSTHSSVSKLLSFFLL